MKTISIIPARGGSRGIKRKNLRIISKKPLLYYTVTASLNARKVDRTFVTTEDKEIALHAKKLGAEVIKRPKSLASNTAQLEPVMFHVLKTLYKKERYIPDVLILLQNTSPLRNSNHIDKALNFFFRNNYDSLLSGYASHISLWEKKNNQVYPLNYNPKKRPRRQEMSNQFTENGAIYITTFKAFKKSKCRISGKIGMFVMSQKSSLEIDNEFELDLAQHVMNRFRK